MTKKDITLYGVEKYSTDAMNALQRLHQMGYEWPEGFDTLPIFRAGYAAAVEAMEIAKKKKADKKSKKFDIYDFINLRLHKNKHGYNFMETVYYDGENKRTVTTNGVYMIYCDAAIPEGYENKLVNKDGVFIDARFPSYTKCIPEEKDIIETDAGDFINAIYNTDINMNMTEAAAFKSNTWYKIGEFVFSAYYIKWLSKFLKTQKNVKVFIREKDRLHDNGEIYQPKNECAIKIIGDSATMVIMPGRSSNIENAVDLTA